MSETLKPMTVKDLQKLCNSLVAHGKGDAEILFCGGEYGAYLDEFGDVRYEYWEGTFSGKTFIDIKP